MTRQASKPKLIGLAALITLLITVTNSACRQSFHFAVHVQAQGTSEDIADAQVKISTFDGTAPRCSVTDGGGFARVPIDTSYMGQRALLIVEALGYKKYKREIDFTVGNLTQDVLLELVHPTPTSTPASSASPTPTATPTPSPTSSPTLSPTATRAPTPTLTPATIPTLRPVMPELLAPVQGSTHKSTVTFDWQGSLRPGQAYKVIVRHVESGDMIPSGLLADDTWTTYLPAERYGAWRWTVSVVQGERAVATPPEWEFWLDPFGGGGDGGHRGTKPPPPDEKPDPEPP
jgi:hypothetical protein